MRAPDGGAVAYIGKQRSASAAAERVTPTALFREAFATAAPDPFSNLGTIFYRALMEGGQLPLVAVTRHVIQGDPTMPIFAAAPRTLTVTGPSSVGLGHSSITIHVDDGGVPVSDALVCISQDAQSVGDLLYAYNYTDAFGDVSFDVNVQHSGALLALASAPSYKWNVAAMPVVASGGFLAYEEHELLDGLGDGSGHLLAGEQGTLRVTVRNEGASTVTLQSGVIKPHGGVVFDLRISEQGGAAVGDPTRVAVGAAGANPPNVPFSAAQLAYAGISSQGEPAIPSGGGYAVWQESGGAWKARWQGGTGTVFEGFVRVPGGADQALELDPLEPGDTWQVNSGASGDTLSFLSQAVTPDADGLTWRAVASRFVALPGTHGTFSPSVVAPGASSTIEFEDVEVLAADSNGEDLRFEIEAIDIAGHPAGRAEFLVPIAAPRLEAVKQEAMLGVLEYLNYDLFTTVRNVGGAPAHDVAVRIDNELGAIIELAEATGGPIQPGEEIVLGPVKFKTYSPNAVRLRVTLESTMPNGAVSWTRGDVDIKAPTGTVSGLTASTGEGGILLVWEPLADASVVGYNVYRRIASGFERINAGLVDSATAYFDASTELKPEHDYEYTIAAVDQSRNEGPVSIVVKGTMGLEELQGWPKKVPVGTDATLFVGDIDGSPGDEVVLGSQDVWAWHADGTGVKEADGRFWSFAGQPCTFQGTRFFGEFAAYPGEFMVGSTWVPCNGASVHFWTPAGDLLYLAPLSGGGGVGRPVIHNFPGGGEVEVALASRTGLLKLWTYNGSQIAPWGSLQIGGVVQSLTRLGLGDVDGDGTSELVFVGAQTRELYVVDVDGPGLISLLPVYVFPDTAGQTSSPVVVDLDADGVDEIVVARGIGSQSNDPDKQPRLVALQVVAGAVQQLWEVVLGPTAALGNGLGVVPPPHAVDLYGNGDIALLCGDKKGTSDEVVLHVVHTGSDPPLHETWSTPIRQRILGNDRGVLSECSSGNVDGDKYPELFHGTNLRHVMAWDVATKAPQKGWPRTLSDRVFGRVVVKDIDNHGGMEVVASDFGGEIHVWDYQYAGISLRDAPRDDEVARLAPPLVSRIESSNPNPFNPSTTLRYATHEPGRVRLVLYKADGRLVRTLVDGNGDAGYHEVSWDGVREDGRSAASGVYFAVLDVDGEQVDVAKLVLLR